MKPTFVKILTLIIALNLTIPIFSWNEKEAAKAIKETKKNIFHMNKDKDLRKFYPYNLYQEATENMAKAEKQLKDDEEKAAFFYATLAKIQLEKTVYIAKIQKIQLEKIELERDHYKNLYENKPIIVKSAPKEPDFNYESILDANFQKEGNYFYVNLLDKNIFYKNTFHLDESGQVALNKVIKVLNDFPECEIKIVGHTSNLDLKRHSDYKANSIANYLMRQSIKPSRIETLGIGNAEVMETPLGYRRIDRVEIILTNLKS
jgi:outer membrane protein OmpA-like peptidoglycan-associated protein